VLGGRRAVGSSGSLHHSDVDSELLEFLRHDVPAHLGTIDRQGYPRITPIWFIYEDGAFYMSSLVGKRQLEDLRRDPRASIRVDSEEPASVRGVRANRQAGGRGLAELRADVGGAWTRRITLKYVSGEEGDERARLRAAQDRIVIVLRPERLEWIRT